MTNATATAADATDFLGRTPEEVRADKERAARHQKRVAEADWHEIPKGSYAIPVLGIGDWDIDDESGPPVIGYRLFERKVARRCKNGRLIGRDQFTIGAIMMTAEADSDAVWREVQSDWRVCIDVFGPGGDARAIVVQILDDVQDGDTYRAQFGKLVGKCGCCGKPLTEPKSKLLGIGPDCRRAQ